MQARGPRMVNPHVDEYRLQNVLRNSQVSGLLPILYKDIQDIADTILRNKDRDILEILPFVINMLDDNVVTIMYWKKALKQEIKRIKTERAQVQKELLKDAKSKSNNQA